MRFWEPRFAVNWGALQRIEQGRRMQPAISVVTATYKRPWGLLAALRCVQAQSFQDTEHIIVADHCPEAERVVKAAGDNKTIFFNLAENSNDLGVTPANTGAGMAAGEWVAVLADDNLWHRDWLASLYGVAKDAPEDVGIVYGCREVRKKNGSMKGYPKFTTEPWPHWQGIDLGECLYRRSCFEEHGAWVRDHKGRKNYSYDWELIERWMRNGVKWVHVPNAWDFVFYDG